MKKAIIFFLAAVFLPMAIRGQDSLGVELSPEYLALMADTCRPPRLISKSIINYETYSRAYLEFEEVDEGQVFGYRLLDATEGEQVSSSGGEILVQGLLPDNLYEVTVNDNCGDEVVVAVLSTFAENPSVRGIEVSDRMYKAIVDFQQQQGAAPLSEYLEGLESVSPYEKIAFIQQFYFNGQKFQADGGPVPPPPPPPPPVGECLCKMVFNTLQNVTPGTLLPDGSIMSSNDDSDGKIDLNDQASWWWATSTQGAAKWNNIWTEGWHAGSSEYTRTSDVINNVNSSPYNGTVTYNLACNYSVLPRECDCSKPLKLFYRYDTQVDAYANRATFGISEKKARSMAQDMVVVTLRQGSGDVEVLAAGDARAEAECNWSVNSAFYVNLTELAGSIALLFVNENSAQLPTIINSLVSQIGDLITTPYLDESDCDFNATVTATLADDIKEIVMHPNEAVYLNVSSFSNLMAGGKRSWFSWSRILSAFYAAGIVPGGLGEVGEDHCCTQQIVSWVLASSEFPLTTEGTAKELGEFLGTEAAVPMGVEHWPGNIPKLTEWGVDVVIVDERCIVEVPSGETGGGNLVGGGGTDERSPNWSSDPDVPGAHLIVFDVAGHIVFKGKSVFEKSSAIRYFHERSDNLPDGLYFIQLSNEKSRETVKVFLAR